MNRLIPSISILLLFTLPSLAAQEAQRSLFDNVAGTLGEKYHNEEFRTAKLSAIVKPYRYRAHGAVSLKEQREVTPALLSQVPATHLGLLSRPSHDRSTAEMLNNPAPMMGLALVEYDGKHYAQSVYEGRPAEAAGPYSGGGHPISEAGLRQVASQRLLSTSQPKNGGAVALATDKSAQEPTMRGSSGLTDPLGILRKMVEALGGERAIRSHTFRTSTGTIDISGMVSGTITTSAATPNYLLTTIRIDDMNVVVSRGYDGKYAWRDDPHRGGPVILEGQDLANTLRQADFYRRLNYGKRDRIELVGRTEFASKDCYELKLQDKSGPPRSLFIDSGTYLIAGMKTVRELPMVGEAEIVVTNEEYKEFDGVWIVTRRRQKVGDIQEVVTSITDVSFDPIAKSTFALPANIKALLSSE